jgi:hypothetical protein
MVDRFNYEIVKPDQSEIDIKRGYRDIAGKFVWDPLTHKYTFLGLLRVSEPEMKEILGSMGKLNKRSLLPKWLAWGSSRN